MVDEQMQQPFTTASPILTSFNFTDIAEGTGIINFYLSHYKEVTTSFPIMVQNAETYSSSGDRNLSNGVDIDFDLTPFNLSKTIIGVTNISLWVKSTNPAPTITFTLRRVSGGVETTMGSTTMAVLGLTAQFLARIVIADRVNFKKGDFIRLSMQKNNATICFIGTDPTNGATSNFIVGRTRTTIAIPFDLPNQ